MRMRNWMVVISSSLALGAFAVQGCGSTASTPIDAGSAADATLDAPVETGAKDASKDVKVVACPDASITELPIVDASFGDSGQSTSGCVSCLKVKCGTDLSACNDDCECRDAVVKFLNCLPTAKGQNDALVCGITAFSGVSADTQALGQSIALCAGQRCPTECIPPGLDAGP